MGTRAAVSLSAATVTAASVALSATAAYADFDNDNEWIDEAAISTGTNGNVVGFWQAQMTSSKGAMNNPECVKIWGYFGNSTRAGTKNFQNTVGITADGVVGSQTWNQARYFQPWIRTNPGDTRKALVYTGGSNGYYSYSYYGGTAYSFTGIKNSNPGGSWKWNFGGAHLGTQYTVNNISPPYPTEPPGCVD